MQGVIRAFDPAGTEAPSFENLTEWFDESKRPSLTVADVPRSDAPQNDWSSSGHLVSVPDTHVSAAAIGNSDRLYARKDTVDALKRESEVLREETLFTMRAQIVGLEVKMAETRAEASALRAHMADIISQLDALTTPQGTGQTH